MEKTGTEVMIGIIIASLILVILATFTLLFFLLFNRKRKLYFQEKELTRRNYEEALLQTKLEIQAQTMTDIGREIHDNIGQVLSFVKLSLSTSPKDQPDPKKVDDCVQLLAGAIADLRDLSKSLSMERVKNDGLYQVIADECKRLDRSKVIRTRLKINGSRYRLPAPTELVLFRIFQESLNNTLKHSGSEKVTICLNYSPETFAMEISDTGRGMDPAALPGSGLGNISRRAELIGARVSFDNQPGSGFHTALNLPLNLNANDYGRDDHSPGG